MASITRESNVETKTKRHVRRRGNGEGGIRQRADGLWEARISVGADANGRRISRSVYGKTKKIVADKLTELQGLKTKGMLTPASRITVAQLLTSWLEDVVRVDLAPRTYESYRNIVRNHIDPHIGGLRLVHVSPVAVQNFYSTLERAGDSKRMREYTHSVLHRAFEQGIDWGILAANVIDRVSRPVAPKKEINPYDEDQGRAFLTAAQADRLYAMYVLAITTGMRQGELFGLKRDDVKMKPT
jgi:integrase